MHTDRRSWLIMVNNWPAAAYLHRWTAWQEKQSNF